MDVPDGPLAFFPPSVPPYPACPLMRSLGFALSTLYRSIRLFGALEVARLFLRLEDAIFLLLCWAAVGAILFGIR